MSKDNILEVLETARQGFASGISYALKQGDKDLHIAYSFDAHHKMLNKKIVELGGEDVQNETIEIFLNHNGKKNIL